MSVTKKNILNTNIFNYNVNGQALERVDSTKILGVIISNNLTWHNHIDYVCSKANSALYLLRRVSGGMDLDCKVTLYKSLVRPHLDYCSAVWDPPTDELMRKVEIIQARAVRIIFNKFDRNTCVTDLREKLHLPALKTRRKINRLCLLYKIYHDLTILDKTKFFKSALFFSKDDHTFKIQRTICQRDYHLKSFFPNTIREWNSLPKEAVNSNKITSFRDQCNKLFIDFKCNHKM